MTLPLLSFCPGKLKRNKRKLNQGEIIDRFNARVEVLKMHKSVMCIIFYEGVLVATTVQKILSHQVYSVQCISVGIA